MYFNVPEEVKELSEIFRNNGETLYVVGGFVRDSIMDLFSLEHNDLDLCSACKPDKVIKILKNTKFSTDDKNIKFGTVIITGQKRYEFTTFRRENYHLNGEHNPTGVEFIKDIKEDALRRDFTINSIYLDIETGDIVDPVYGVEDIKNQIIRCNGNPTQSFREDGERILRMIRFSCSLNFDIDQKTLLAAFDCYKSIINISKDRIRKEFDKMLVCDTFYPKYKSSEYAHAKCLMLIGKLNLWQYVMPIVENLEKSKLKDEKGELIYDHMINTISVCNPGSRLACIVHDVGKMYTKLEKNNFSFSQDWADVIIEKNLGIEGLYYPKNTVERVKKVVRALDFDKHGFASSKKIRKFIVQNQDVFYEICDLKDAIALENTNFTKKSQIANRWKKIYNKMKDDKTPFSIAELNINGNDIIDEIPEIQLKKIGEILSYLHDFCINHPTCNKKEILINKAKIYVNKNKIDYLE